MVKEYLQHEYKEDIKNIFGAETDQWNGQYSVPYNSDLWRAIRSKNQILAQDDPDRHFALSTMFLFHFVTYMALWDVCIYNHTIDNSDLCRFYEITGWPQMDLTYWKEFTREDPEREFLPEDVNKILGRFGLVHNGVSSRATEFLLFSVFELMLGELNDVFWDWDVPDVAKDRIVEKVRALLGKIQNYINLFQIGI